MKSLVTRKTLGVAVALALLTACGGGNAGAPSAASGSAQTSMQRNESADATSGKLSGQYGGTMVDKASGTRKATMWLAQQQGALGGHIRIPQSPDLNDEVVWSVSGKTLSGYIVSITASGYCSYSAEATYSNHGRELRGSYSATYGCSGDTGSFSFKHKCYFQGEGSDVRRNVGPKSC